MSTDSLYVGRFAPTPSGPLHFGSIVAALASFLEARRQNGKWLLRIDDLDTPRVNQAATDIILNSLDQLNLEWDGSVIYQSKRLDIYQSALSKLMDRGLLFHCTCPRKLTKGIPYPGTCRKKPAEQKKSRSIRVITNNTSVNFTDLVQGEIQQNIQLQSGDFIVMRSDKIFSYNLAAAIDDSSEGITDVIRGADLLDTTPKQIYLQSLLALPSPVYGHVPVAMDITGHKISKRTGALDALLNQEPARVLVDVLEFLGQGTEIALEKSDSKTVIQWALENWDINRVPKLESITHVDRQ